MSVEYEKLLDRFGPELEILMHTDLDALEKSGPPLLAEALRRMRESRVHVAAGYDGEYGVIRLFETTEWREVMQLRGHRLYVYSLAFSGDGETLASGSGDGDVRTWSTRLRREH